MDRVQGENWIERLHRVKPVKLARDQFEERRIPEIFIQDTIKTEIICMLYAMGKLDSRILPSTACKLYQ